MKFKPNSYYKKSHSKDKHVKKKRTLHLYGVSVMQFEFNLSNWYMFSV